MTIFQYGYTDWMTLLALLNETITNKHISPLKITNPSLHFTSLSTEYKNLDEMKNRRLSATFALPFQWDGAGHVVYNGSFYYHHLNKDYIIRYDLTTGSIIERVSLSTSIITFVKESKNHPKTILIVIEVNVS